MELLLNKTEYRDREISRCMANHLMLIIGKNMIVSTGGIFYEYNSIFNSLILAYVMLSYLRLVFKVEFLIRMRKQTMAIISFVAVFILISKLLDDRLFSDNTFPYEYVFKQSRIFVSYGLPLFLGISSLTDFKYLLKYLFARRYLLFVFALIGFAEYLCTTADVNTYSMSYGNNVVFVSMLFIFSYVNNHNKKDIVLFGVTVFFIFVIGSRGPMIYVALSIFVAFCYNKITVNKVIILIFVAVMIIFSRSIINLVIYVFNIFGLNSRTLNMFLSENIVFDSGRSEYHNKLLSAINEHPLTGLGAFGGEKTVGLAHGFYYDVFANFGYIFGTLLLIYIAVKCLKILRSKNNQDMKLFLIIQLVLFAPRGFYDDTFWGSKEFWMILGIIVVYNQCSKCKYKKILE